MKMHPVFEYAMAPFVKATKQCHSDCDCGAPVGPHDPDCHSWTECDEGHFCDKHFATEMVGHAHLKDTPRREVFGKENWTQDDWDAHDDEQRCIARGIDP